MKKTWLLIFCFSVLLTKAYPVKYSLKSFIQNSVVIAVIEVDSIFEKKPPKDEAYNTIDYLPIPIITLNEILKGSIENKQLHMIPMGIVCPPPPKFRKEKKAILFLQKKPEGDSISTIYAHTIEAESEEEYLIYRKAILDFLEMEKSGLSEEKIVEWLVRLAENQYTKNHACDDLNLMNFPADKLDYENGIDEYSNQISKFHRVDFTDTQLVRLLAVFLNAKPSTESELYLTHILSRKYKEKVLQHLINQLDPENHDHNTLIGYELIFIHPNPELRAYFEDYHSEVVKYMPNDEKIKFNYKRFYTTAQKY